ncbi:MAG: 50S ribosomal protein L24 [Spirochaetota bacterium]|nr:50S ribosomal protein L24 [Spirochaetota bacterium]
MSLHQKELEKNLKIKYKLKHNDEVIVITGRDKGKTGSIQEVYRKKGKVKIQGVNLVKKHRRATQERQTGEIVDIPAALDISNVMIMCPICKTGVRIKLKRVDNKKKRHCHKCDHSFDK